MKLSEVNMIFCDLIDHLYLQLSATEKFSFDLFETCSAINPLLKDQWLQKINNCKSLHFLKICLLQFVSWLDYSVLKELVIASGNENAQQLLNLFDSKISSYSNKPITSFPILSPSQLMIPLDGSDYTLLAMKFHPPSRGDATQSIIILQDVMDIKLIMKRNWKLSNHEINSIQLVAVYMKLKLMYWMSPMCLIKKIENNIVFDWKSGIVMLAVLPASFYSLEKNDSETLIGPFSVLNFLRHDDNEVYI